MQTSVDVTQIHGRVVVGKTTRDPTEVESREIKRYLTLYSQLHGLPPLGVHDVPDLGDVWFMRAYQGGVQ